MKALHAESILAEIKLQKSSGKLEAAVGRVEKAIQSSSSPLERERYRKLLHDLKETAGAIRYSPVTGHDASDLPR